MKATLGFIAVLSFMLMIIAAEELGIVFVLSAVSFACTMIKFNQVNK